LQFVLPVAILAAGVAAALGLASLRKAPASAPREAAVPLVRTLIVEERAVELAVRAHGTVAPRTQTRLIAEVPGRVVRVSPALASGGFFEEGEELLGIDPTDSQLALEDARARVAQTELALAQEEADAELALRDWESMGGGRPASPLLLRTPHLARARAEAGAARAALAKAERDVERCSVRAPYPGRVSARSVDLGQYVERGEDLARVYAVDWAEVRLPIPDDDLARLELPFLAGTDAPGELDGDLAPGAVGPAVRLATRFAGGAPSWDGVIDRIEGEIDPESRMVVLVARVEDPYGRRSRGARAPLLAGMFVEATIAGRSVPAAVVLPRSALQAGGRVFVVDRESRLAVRPVEVLEARRDEVVLGAGLAAGERVVVSPLELPVEGMRLRPEDSEAR